LIKLLHSQRLISDQG